MLWRTLDHARSTNKLQERRVDLQRAPAAASCVHCRTSRMFEKSSVQLRLAARTGCHRASEPGKGKAPDAFADDEPPRGAGVSAGGVVILLDSRRPEFVRRRAKHRTQVEMPIRDVKGDQAARTQALEG